MNDDHSPQKQTIMSCAKLTVNIRPQSAALRRQMGACMSGSNDKGRRMNGVTAKYILSYLLSKRTPQLLYRDHRY